MLFGGYSSADGLVKQDTWEWSGTDANWVPRTNANAKPPGRQQGAMVYDSKRDQLLLWGGSGTGVTNDLWSWSPTTRNWTMLTVNGTPPPNVANYPMFYDPIRDTLEIYINYYTYYDFDLATSTWTNRYDSKNPPPNAFYEPQLRRGHVRHRSQQDAVHRRLRAPGRRDDLCVRRRRLGVGRDARTCSPSAGRRRPDRTRSAATTTWSRTTPPGAWW